MPYELCSCKVSDDDVVDVVKVDLVVVVVVVEVVVVVDYSHTVVLYVVD